jgi:hypothetical protein
MPSKEYMEEFSYQAEQLHNQEQELLERKHSKYGKRPLVRSGLNGILTKLDIKIERLRNLLEQKPDLDDMTEAEEWKEDVREQLIDISNYGTLGLMVHHNLLPRGE